MELKRKALIKLEEWKKTSNGKTALLIKGARRTGKTWLARKFGETCYESYLYVDFANMDKDLVEIFEDASHLDFFFIRLQAYYGVQLIRRKSLVIFDEVQLFPKARQLIKYLVADGRFDYIETGSLIGLRQNVENIVIPSEEEILDLNPLDFEEFLWANNEEALADLIRDSFENKRALGQALHRKALNLFRLYLVIGGMPQSVTAFLKAGELEASESVKRNILTVYRNDVTKFAKGHEYKVIAIFDDIPSQLSRHEKRFKLSCLDKKARLRGYEESFVWLSEANIVNLCFNATDPTVGLSLNADRMTLKCYFADTGLLLTQAINSGQFLKEDVLKALLYGKLEINEGMILENAVAQMLLSTGHKLYFYSRAANNEKKTPAIEIDFLIRQGKKICPIEVKSSPRIRHASLDLFVKRFSSRLGTRYVLYTKDLYSEGKTLYIPAYMAYLL